MPACPNHPERLAGGRCAHCIRALCGDCLTEVNGTTLCARCRPPAPGSPAARPTFADQVIPTKNSAALLGYYLAVFSLIPCAGLALGPAAVVCGSLGLRARREDPNLPGKAHAITALVLGGITSLVNLGLVLLTLISLFAVPG